MAHSKRERVSLFGVFSGMRAQILLVGAIMFFDSLVFILPYYWRGSTLPAGWDTPWYISNMRLIEEQGLFVFFERSQQVNLFCILEYVFASIFNISFTMTTIILPVTIGLLFPLVNFLIVRELKQSWKLALIGMIFTVVDYNTVRMTGLLHRNLFCFLLIQVAVFLVLPDLLTKPSKKKLLVVIILLVVAGLAQIETFAISVFMLFVSIIFYLKERLPRTAKILSLCALTSASIVIVLEAPFIPQFTHKHIILNPSVRWYRQNFVASPWNYLASFGAGLIPFYIVGMYDLLKKAIEQQEERSSLIFEWNVIAISGSFLPLGGIRVPGWRFLCLITVPPIAALGLGRLFFRRDKVKAKKVMAPILVISLVLSLYAVIYNQRRSYRPFISMNEYKKMTRIGSLSQNCPNVIFILYFDYGRYTPEWVELYSRWIWATVGTKTNVYFGYTESLMESQPTDFENEILNHTSYFFWDKLEDFSLDKAQMYTIEEWYEKSIKENLFMEVETGIYLIELD